MLCVSAALAGLLLLGRRRTRAAGCLLLTFLLGAALGILGMFIMPEFPASDYLTAAAVGIVSGLAATGINQVYKQLTKEG